MILPLGRRPFNLTRWFSLLSLSRDTLRYRIGKYSLTGHDR
jgi:hypothetical protein